MSKFKGCNIVDRIVFENEFFKVKLNKNILALDNLKGGVVVLPLTKKNQVLMIKVYRAAIDQISLELPRGFKEENEHSIEAAKRELFEETNLISEDLIPLGSIYPDSGLVNSEIDLFIAKGINIENIRLQSIEGIKEFELMDFAQALNLAIEGEIKDAFSLSAILRSQKYII